jgi:hypothetical protein
MPEVEAGLTGTCTNGLIIVSGRDDRARPVIVNPQWPARDSHFGKQRQILVLNKDLVVAVVHPVRERRVTIVEQVELLDLRLSTNQMAVDESRISTST